jgi:hypothetical protein
MPFTHVTGEYNVESTLRNWLYVQITDNRPPLVSATRINFDFPEKPIVPPCWSVHFLDVTPGRPLQGDYVGDNQHGRQMFGLAEVSAWVTRQANPGWRGQLAQMVDAVTKAVHSVQSVGGNVIIKDFYTSTSAPANVTYRITIEGCEVRTPPTDPNPDFERRRILIPYFWVERA